MDIRLPESLWRHQAALMSEPVLTTPDYCKPFILHMDTLDHGICAVISQGDGQDEHPVAYNSRELPREVNYQITDKEWLAVVDAYKHFLLSTKDPTSGCIDHWLDSLWDLIDFNNKFLPGSSNTNGLSWQTWDDHSSI